jgi:hypothetical protein
VHGCRGIVGQEGREREALPPSRRAPGTPGSGVPGAFRVDVCGRRRAFSGRIPSELERGAAKRPAFRGRIGVLADLGGMMMRPTGRLPREHLDPITHVPP